jgi:hypothetical protein
LRGLRKHPVLSNAWIVFCCERNTAHEAGFLADEVTAYEKHALIAEKGDDDWGWWSTNSTKTQQAYAAWSSVSLGQVSFLKNWVCENPMVDGVSRRKHTKDKFTEQLRRYSEYAMQTRDPLSIPRTGVSGVADKEGKASSTFNDDLAFCFCFNIWLIEKLRRHQVPGFPYFKVFNYYPQGGDVKRGVDGTIHRDAKRRRL